MKEMDSVLQRVELCGCGSGHWDIVILLLERAENTLKDGKSFYQEAEDASGRWVEFGAKVLASYDLLEHGTGIGRAWLTEDGKAVLAWLRKHGTEENMWPDGKWKIEWPPSA